MNETNMFQTLTAQRSEVKWHSRVLAKASKIQQYNAAQNVHNEGIYLKGCMEELLRGISLWENRNE